MTVSNNTPETSDLQFTPFAFSVPALPDENVKADGSIRGTDLADKSLYRAELDEFIETQRKLAQGFIGKAKDEDYLFNSIRSFARYYQNENCPDAGKNLALQGVGESEGSIANVKQILFDDDELLPNSAVALIAEVANGKTNAKGDKQLQGISFRGRASSYDVQGISEHLSMKGQLHVIADHISGIFKKMQDTLALALVAASGGEVDKANGLCYSQTKYTANQGHAVPFEVFAKTIQAGLHNRAAAKASRKLGNFEVLWTNRQTSATARGAASR